MLKLVLSLLVLSFCTSVLWAQSDPQLYQPQRDVTRIPRQPYLRYFTLDRFGRKINFYLSEMGSNQKPLPLVVFIQGSGCSSLFNSQNGIVVPSLGHITVQEAAADQARVLIVEKPGVKFLDQPQDCSSASEFNREHTLERWAEAVEAAVRAVQLLPEIQKNKVLVIGHSEGGLVACRVARDLPQLVTHVALIAGGGLSQLFDLMTLARKGNFFREISEQPEARIKYLLDQWSAIQNDPLSAEKFFFGFAYRRWSTFLATSPLAELQQVSAKIYIAQGTADEAVDPASADALYSQLLADHKHPVYDRVEGADHSFNIKDNPQTNGWREQLNRIVGWFLQS